MLRRAFGRRLRFLRLLVNKTQAGLAEAVGVTEEHLGNIERGASVPSFQLICRLARELDTPPNNLFLFNELDLCEEVGTDAEWNGMDWKQYVTKVGYWAFDPDKGGVTFSNSLFEILGREPSPRIVDPARMLALVFPEDLPSVRDCWIRFLKGQYPASHTFRFYRKDGTVRMGLVQGEVEEDEHGKLVRFHGVFLDITEQKRFEASLLATRRKMEEQVAVRTRDMREALARAEREAVVRARAEEDLALELERRLTAEGERLQSEAQLELILGSMTDGVTFFRGPDLAVAWCNQTYAGVQGRTPSQMKGRICYEFIQKGKAPCPNCPVIKAFADGRPAEVERRGEDGRIWSLRAFPVLNGAGEVTGVAEFSRDVTDRRRVEEGRRLFETIVNASTEPMALLDRNGVFLAANPAHAQYHGPGGSDLEGSHFYEFVDPEAYREALEPQFDRALDGEIVEFEAWLNFPARERTCMAVRLYPHRDTGGEVVGVAVIATDITEAKVIQERLRVHSQILSSLPDAIFFVDRLLVYRIVNDAYLGLYGVGREEIEGRPVSGSMPAEDYEQNVRPYLEQALAGETARHTAWFDFRGYGRRCMDVTYAPCRDEENAVIGAVAHFRDVTGRVRVQEALVESEERFRLLAEYSPDIVWLTGSDCMPTYFSPACERILGYSPEELTNLTPADVFAPECLDRVHADIEEERVNIEQGKPLGRMGQKMDFTHIAKDGRRVEVEIIRTPIYDSRNRLRGVVGISRDVSEERKAQAKVRESLEKYRILFELEFDAIFLVDDETTRILEANRAAENILGYPRDELMGKSMADLSTEPELTIQSSKTELVNAERYYRRKDGRVVPVEVSTSHFYWQNRHVHIAALRDLSDRKRLEQERRDVERMLRHELRTPAQAAVTVANVLRDEGGFTGDSLKMLNELERHGRCMLETMDIHADLHRLETGRFLPRDQVVDVADICAAASRDMAYLAKARSVNLELAPPSGRGSLPGDRRLLRSAAINLIKNALEASRPGDSVRLGCAVEDGRLLISVRNPGVVPEDFRERMFEKYATQGKVGGQGLGCYLARRVAEAHGGDIRVDCGDGRSTEVVMSLPCRPER